MSVGTDEGNKLSLVALQYLAVKSRRTYPRGLKKEDTLGRNQ